MASTQSLGISTPSAVPYLVSEGILPPDPDPSLYTLKTYGLDRKECGQVFEELLYTSTCVAWARGGTVRKLYTFDIEHEPVKQAVFAKFKDVAGKNVRSGASQRESDGKPQEKSNQSPEVDGLKPSAATTPAKEVKGVKDTRGAGAEQKDVGPENGNYTGPFSAPDDATRAIVVFLKTQAHIYFINGTHYLVHLPFEVASVFPLPVGLLLQRSISQGTHTESSPKIPPAPPASFAFSQWSSFGPQPPVFGQITSEKSKVESAPAIQSMLDALFSHKQKESTPGSMPAHFHLCDPIAELGQVVEVKRRSTGPSGPLDPLERIIYVSEHSISSDLLVGESVDQNPTTIALSINVITGQYNIWTITDASKNPKDLNRRLSSWNSGATTRRRSSFGPGTGATTPARTSMAPRESFGQFHDESQINDDIGLESQLDSAFEPPGAPPKSSRRISSLLARSEVSGNRDTSNLADLTSSHRQSTGARRGPSFGGAGNRKGVGHLGVQERSKRNASSSHTHLDVEDLEMADGPASDDSDNEEEAAALPDLPNTLPFSLHRELLCKKVDSFGAITNLSSSQTSKSRRTTPVDVFRLDPPKHTVIKSDGHVSVLCVMEHSSRQFFIVYLGASAIRSKKGNKEATSRIQVKLLQVKRSDSVIDACKITDGSSSRLLVMTSTNEAASQLSLQSPWGIQASLHLPRQFLIHNPFQVDHSKSLVRKRESGFKRVLSEGPDEIVGLQECPARGQCELRDSTGVKHRIQITLKPHNQFVSRILQTCEYALHTVPREREPLQRVWWEVMNWLAQRQTSGDLEWRSLLISIFVLFVPHLGVSTTAPARTKRKGGFLRSSSGANTDLQDFDEMMKSECAGGRAQPAWMQQSAWAWMFEEANEQPVSRTSSPQSSVKRNSGSFQKFESSVLNKKMTLQTEHIDLAREFVQTPAGQEAVGSDGYLPTALSVETKVRDFSMPTTLIALHLLREELKLDILASEQLHALTPILAQLGSWLGWEDWGSSSSSFFSLESAEMERISFNDARLNITTDIKQPLAPPSILELVELCTHGNREKTFPTLVELAPPERSEDSSSFALAEFTPRTSFILELLKLSGTEPASVLKLMEDSKITTSVLETFPEGIAAPLRSAIVSCQMNPEDDLSKNALDLIDRNDISMLDQRENIIRVHFRGAETTHESTRDYHAICNSTLEVDQVGAYDGSAELDRQAVTRMVFKEDQRFYEASRLLHPLKRATARCEQEIGWTETDLLEAQHEVAKVVAIRTLSVSPGRGMLYFSARFPLLTEKFPIHGFSLSCLMTPTNTIVTADKNIYTEEKVAWAFFHAGVEAGLSISKDAKGIDTSWILFNKPPELNNRHAGFLLALGLNGHLKNIAKWVAFKYLTPKHTMTSIGLLLGLAASYLGTMDTLITRLLSVHVTRMLPPGAAELNLSPLTQTTGIMSIGLLYCNTQHRRMSEIMLSEMENIELDDTNNPLENLRDEGYRLASGFALGYINLGQGKKMSGLRDMRIVERLLALAVATKRVDIVHILDKATAGATVAIALIFMKTGDEALAKKIDIPDTTHQYVYVRPDLFLLRTVARHLIMWDSITPSFTWMKDSLPSNLKDQYRLGQYRYLNSEQLPLFNVIAGLCLSLGLRYAGTARQDVRDLLGHYLDSFMEITRTPGTSYDEKLTRTTARNCQDVIALAAASVMAGTGDIFLFRRLRILHNRTDPETPYGSHLATHQAIGVLFLGGGTHTFNTSNLAVASLLCAFYPLFPTGVLDNKSHLQAFRHFWVLASEPRCLIVRNVEARRPITMPVVISLLNGEELDSKAPCLLPALDNIARIESNDPQYWPVKLDFVNNPSHREAFARHQSMFVRRRGAYNSSATVFGTTLRALNDAAMTHQLSKHSFEWLFSLPSFQHFDRAERALVLPNDGASLMHNAARGTAVDSRLALERGSLRSSNAEKLWDLRVLFAWASKMAREKNELNWLGKEVLDGLRAKVQLMGREAEEQSNSHM